MKTRTKGANGDKKIAKDLRGPNLSIDGKWRSFPKVPNLLQYVITGSFYGRVKVDGKIYRESLEVSKARFTGSSSRSCPTSSLRSFARSARLEQKDSDPLSAPLNLHRTFDICNKNSYILSVRTSCRFAVAVHVLAVLAYKEGEAVTSALLASSVNTNPVVIRRLLLLLQAAGFIETCRGAGAGSRLSRVPERITLAEVYQAVETDEPFALHSKRPNQACPVGNCIQAALERVFASAEEALQKELAKTSMADILESVKASCSRSGKGHE